MFELDIRKGGANRLGNHMKQHGASDGGTISFQRNLPTNSAAGTAKAVASAVPHDLCLMSFTDRNKDGMKTYVPAVFKAGPSVPLGVNVNPDSYMPTRTVLTAALNELPHEHCDKFQYLLKNEILAVVGAVSIYGVNLKVQRKHCYDVTLHYIKSESTNVPCGPSKVQICKQTIVLIDGSYVPSAANLVCH